MVWYADCIAFDVFIESEIGDRRFAAFLMRIFKLEQNVSCTTVNHFIQLLPSQSEIFLDPISAHHPYPWSILLIFDEDEQTAVNEIEKNLERTYHQFSATPKPMVQRAGSEF